MYGQRPPHTSSARLTAKPTVKPVNFVHIAPEAQEVYLVGAFNHWNLRSHPMQRQVDGSWQISVPLPHGGHHYQFIVDGHPVNDPKAHGLVRDPSGNKVSMRMVS